MVETEKNHERPSTKVTQEMIEDNPQDSDNSDQSTKPSGNERTGVRDGDSGSEIDPLEEARREDREERGQRQGQKDGQDGHAQEAGDLLTESWHEIKEILKEREVQGLHFEDDDDSSSAEAQAQSPDQRRTESKDNEDPDRRDQGSENRRAKENREKDRGKNNDNDRDDKRESRAGHDDDHRDNGSRNEDRKKNDESKTDSRSDSKSQQSGNSSGEESHAKPTVNSHKIKIGGIVILVLLVIGAIVFTLLKNHSEQGEAKDRQSEQQKGPWVKTADVKAAPEDKDVHLVGETRPFVEAVLYAKISGYLKEVRVDKGDVVKAGQILAVIESPETKQAYLSALADANNKTRIAQRIRPLEKQEFVSPQEAEQVYADASMARAKLQSEKALLDYEIVRAPFDGIITARFADPGALIQSAANSQSSALAIVTISRTDKLRIYTYVDQSEAASMQVGVPADITIDGRPDLKLKATISRVSGQLDEKSKMLLTELDYDNSKGEIVSGSYVNISMKIKNPKAFIVPSDALVVMGNKQKVVTVGNDNVAHYHDVQVLDNDGINARLLSGVQVGQKVVLMSGQDMKEGSPVRQAKAEAQDKKQGQNQGKDQSKDQSQDQNGSQNNVQGQDQNKDQKPEAGPQEHPETQEKATQ